MFFADPEPFTGLKVRLAIGSLIAFAIGLFMVDVRAGDEVNLVDAVAAARRAAAPTRMEIETVRIRARGDLPATAWVYWRQVDQDGNCVAAGVDAATRVVQEPTIFGRNGQWH